MAPEAVKVEEALRAPEKEPVVAERDARVEAPVTAKVPATYNEVFAVVVPTLILPVGLMASAVVPEAVTRNGLTVEPAAVFIFTRTPVPLLFAVSLKVNRLLGPVDAFQVNVVVEEPMAKESEEVGAARLAHEVDPPAPPAAFQESSPLPSLVSTYPAPPWLLGQL